MGCLNGVGQVWALEWGGVLSESPTPVAAPDCGRKILSEFEVLISDQFAVLIVFVCVYQYTIDSLSFTWQAIKQAVMAICNNQSVFNRRMEV